MIFNTNSDLKADPIANPAGESKRGALTVDFSPQRNSFVMRWPSIQTILCPR
jgi:hypothetical protein